MTEKHKTTSSSNDYRAKYKRYYGIDFDETYDVHHIDLNHNNNDITNLLLLPKELHQRYHKALYDIAPLNLDDIRKINNSGTNYWAAILIEYGQVLREILPWLQKKTLSDLNIRSNNNG